MRVSFTPALSLLLVVPCAFPSAFSQDRWETSWRDREILLDGRIEEWDGVPALALHPEGERLENQGAFGPDDLRFDVRALWDKENLYLGVDWYDDVWDIQEIRRREAVWITPDKRRRDRMLFFDYFKIHIRTNDYDYTFWTSPRADEQGPFAWHRVLEGLSARERAVSAPLISARQSAGRVTMEIQLPWKELKIDAGKASIPLVLTIADSDLPGRPLEFKLNQLKWLSWSGRLRFLEKSGKE